MSNMDTGVRARSNYDRLRIDNNYKNKKSENGSGPPSGSNKKIDTSRMFGAR